MGNAGLDESQVGIKIAGRNINNAVMQMTLPTLVAESERELKILLMKVKEESEKPGLKLNIQKPKIMASSPITLWQIDGEKMETAADFIFQFSSVAQLCLTLLQPHESQHARPPCPSPSPGVHSDSHPLSP